jgi:hypothetical protein
MPTNRPRNQDGGNVNYMSNTQSSSEEDVPTYAPSNRNRGCNLDIPFGGDGSQASGFEVLLDSSDNVDSAYESLAMNEGIEEDLDVDWDEELGSE